jgi:hypothetical protein
LMICTAETMEADGDSFNHYSYYRHSRSFFYLFDSRTFKICTPTCSADTKTLKPLKHNLPKYSIVEMRKIREQDMKKSANSYSK